MPPQTFTPVSGTDGRVRKPGGTPVVIAGISKWEFPRELTPIPVPHFESPADAHGIVYPQHLKGMAKGTLKIEGFYNANATDNTEAGTTGLYNGADVVLDLYYSKANTLGYPGVTGFVTNFTVIDQADNQAVKFTCDILMTNTPPAPGTIT